MWTECPMLRSNAERSRLVMTHADPPLRLLSPSHDLEKKSSKSGSHTSSMMIKHDS